MKNKIKKIFYIMAIAVSMVCAFNVADIKAAQADVKFQQQEYVGSEGQEIKVDITISSDEVVGKYRVEVKTDADKLGYAGGGDSYAKGVVVLEGTGVANEVKYQLTFKCLENSESGIKLGDVQVSSSAGENMELKALAYVPVHIVVSDSKIDKNNTAYNIPVVGKVVDDAGKNYYIMDLTKVISSDTDWKYTNVKADFNGQEITFLSDAAKKLHMLYLVDDAYGLKLYAYEPDSRQLYPCYTVNTEKGKYYYMSAYVTKQWDNGLTKDIIEDNDIVLAMDKDGATGFYSLDGEELTSWKESTGNDNGDYFKLILIIVLALLAIIVVARIAVVSSKRRRKKKKKKKQAAAKQSEFIEFINVDNTSKIAPADVNKGRQPVISVKDLSMRFKISTNNSSGVKEYFIQKIKKQVNYREFYALRKVSFDVYKGEVVGIIGTNGSGKSTLLRIISGAMKPSSGTVEVDKDKIQLLTLGTGFDMELTARENVYLNGAIIGYTKEFIDKNYDKIVEFAELQGFMEEKVKNFSSGMVSRLGFAIATVGKAAEILILDEVLSVGDEFFRKKSLDRVKEMIHGGSTVLLVSHSTSVITENCSKVVWIEKGRLRMVGEPRQVCEAYRNMNESRQIL